MNHVTMLHPLGLSKRSLSTSIIDAEVSNATEHMGAFLGVKSMNERAGWRDIPNSQLICTRSPTGARDNTFASFLVASC